MVMSRRASSVLPLSLASVEDESVCPEQEAAFFEAMSGHKFIPAGRILAGAGTGRNVTLFNCFVMGTIPDDMSGIFEHLKEAALTMQAGGGIGYDFSTLRPKGAPARGVGADASGPLTFMDVWDSMCRTVMSAGHRRGAMMATMRRSTDYFVTAQTLQPADHVRMQAAAQPDSDSAISKTINVPENINFEAFKDVHMQAWNIGCTTYRLNDVTGSVLSVEPAKPADTAAPIDRPEALPGQT